MTFVPPPPDPQLSKLFGWFLILIAVPLAYLATTTVLEKSASKSWPRTEAQILSSNIDERMGRDGRHWCVKLHYKYFVDNAEYASSRIFVSRTSGGLCHRKKHVAEALWERLQPETRIYIRYDPTDHGRAFVYRSGLNFLECLLFGLVALLCIGGIKAIKAAKRTGLKSVQPAADRMAADRGAK